MVIVLVFVTGVLIFYIEHFAQLTYDIYERGKCERSRYIECFWFIITVA